jgi:HD superfamily phosphohydrolase YqeK
LIDWWPWHRAHDNRKIPPSISELLHDATRDVDAAQLNQLISQQVDVNAPIGFTKQTPHHCIWHATLAINALPTHW